MPAATDIIPARYRDPRLVARGGMGEVYRASDTLLDRTVAVKLLDERYATDENVRLRFTREALMAAGLSSEPGIVKIFDVAEIDGRPFIVMEYLPGGSLDDELRRGGARPPAQVLGWLHDAAEALDFAHAQGIVHRDVKPANLLLDEAGRVHVADFGVASAASLGSLTQTGMVIGTAGYLSPEQAEGRGASAASDRYALGIVAFQLLAGSRPFERTNAIAEAGAHVQSPVPSITGLRPALPAELDGIFERALSKNPAARYPTNRAFVAALRLAFDHATAPSPRAAPVALLPKRRRWLFVPLFAALVLAAGAAAAYLVARSERGNARAQVIRVTVTKPGTTETVKATPAPTPASTTSSSSTLTSTSTTTTTTITTTPGTTRGGVTSQSAAADGYAKIKAGDYTAALPLLEQAARDLQGTHSLSEAYNDYNLALTLVKLRGCDAQVLQLLDTSQAIQGRRAPIDSLRASCTH
jgi:serine/threonine-protein kinase